MSEILAILDKEKEYLEQLIHYIKLKEGFNFTIVAFTDESAYLEYEAENSVAILLYQNDYHDIVMEQSSAKQKIALVETKITSDDENKKSIFKYQSVEIIIKEILKCYEGTHKIHIRETVNSDLCVIGVCSPAQEPSSNLISLSLAYEYGKTRKTLLLSFDPFLNSKILGVREEIQGISELIYFMKQKNNNLSLKINSIVDKKETFDYIAGVSHWIDLFELMEEETNKLLNEIKTNLGYDVIIIDMGNFNHFTLALMEHCDYIYQVMNKGELHREKDREFRRQVILKKDELFAKKIFQIASLNLELDIDLWVSIKEGKFNQFAKELIVREGLLIGTGERL